MNKSYHKFLIISSLFFAGVFLVHALKYEEVVDKNTPVVVEISLEIKPLTNEETANETSPHDLVEPVIEKDWHLVKIKSGDNLSKIFARIGLTPQDVYRVSESTRSSKVLTRLMPGQNLDFIINQSRIERIRHVKTPLEEDLIIRNKDGSYRVKNITREPELHPQFVNSTIQSSLFVDGQKAGLSQKKLMELATIFGWDIDFALDIRAGDSFSVIYDEKFLNGRSFGEGDILAAQFINQGYTINAVRHTDGNYYNEDGLSMRKAFLRSPVDFFRISSEYNPKRKHPILKTVRPHRGVDYAAPSGTPIKASGNGKVIWRGTKGGYGRTVIIQHAGIYTTLYAHMSKYNSKANNGSRVKQGQVIGYIGQSGLATGPNLHYEFRVNGVHQNPLKVKRPNIQPLNNQQMETFKSRSASLLKQLQAYNLGSG